MKKLIILSALTLPLALSACVTEVTPVFAGSSRAEIVTGVNEEGEEVKVLIQDEDDPNKVICKTEKITGSNLRTYKACKTKQEWEYLADNTRKSVKRSQTQIRQSK